LCVEFHTDSGIVKAVNNMNLSLNRSETLGLVGETGAGKTTTALSILNLISDPPGVITDGVVEFEGEDVLKKKGKEMRAIRGKKISMIFQDPMTSLNPVMTIGDQIKEVIELHTDLNKKDQDKRVLEMLELVGIRPERVNDYPHQLSGGMKQRIVIAMALACNPEIIIADEPTTALDVTIQAQVLELMKDLKRKFNTSIIMITHDLGVIAEIADRVDVVYAGEVVESGSTKDIYTNKLHPYTIGLFESIPSLTDDVERLAVIPGATPDPTDLPKGCKFHPRCTHCMEKCKTQDPKIYEVEEDHFVKCFLFENSDKTENKEV
ncbi:MAG: ABC transporter ATP-binding protein, partial [Ezakiella massiliensis]